MVLLFNLPWIKKYKIENKVKKLLLPCPPCRNLPWQTCLKKKVLGSVRNVFSLSTSTCARISSENHYSKKHCFFLQVVLDQASHLEHVRELPRTTPGLCRAGCKLSTIQIKGTNFFYWTILYQHLCSTLSFE